MRGRRPWAPVGFRGTSMKRAGGYDPAKGPKHPDNHDPTLDDNEHDNFAAHAIVGTHPTVREMANAAKRAAPCAACGTTPCKQPNPLTADNITDDAIRAVRAELRQKKRPNAHIRAVLQDCEGALAGSKACRGSVAHAYNKLWHENHVVFERPAAAEPGVYDPTRIRITKWHNADPNRPYCALIDGEPMRDINGRRVRTFNTEDAAMKAAQLEIVRRSAE